MELQLSKRELELAPWQILSYTKGLFKYILVMAIGVGTTIHTFVPILFSALLSLALKDWFFFRKRFISDRRKTLDLRVEGLVIIKPQIVPASLFVCSSFAEQK